MQPGARAPRASASSAARHLGDCRAPSIIATGIAVQPRRRAARAGVVEQDEGAASIASMRVAHRAASRKLAASAKVAAGRVRRLSPSAR